MIYESDYSQRICCLLFIDKKNLISFAIHETADSNSNEL